MMSAKAPYLLTRVEETGANWQLDLGRPARARAPPQRDGRGPTAAPELLAGLEFNTKHGRDSLGFFEPLFGRLSLCHV